MHRHTSRLSLRGDRLRLARLGNYAKRAIIRVLTLPARVLPEGHPKTAVRRLVLTVQNSLPTELAVNAGDTVVQIGTPWPQTLRRFRRAIGPEGRLVIFEAMPDNAARLRATVEEDGFTNVTIFEGAAFSTRQSGTLMTSPHRGDNKIRLDGIRMDNDLRPINARMGEIAVEFHRIDDVLADLGIDRLNFLSVTVNGAELEVLKGAEATLRNSPDLRVYSKGHARLADGTPINRPIKSYLEELGFRAVITRGEPSSARDEGWLYRDGDVYAWKP
jgi:FkbM family methyltransferase